MSIFLKKKTGNSVNFGDKQVAQVFYQKKRVFPQEIDNVDYFSIDNQNSDSGLTITLTNQKTLGIKLEYSFDKVKWFTFNETNFFGDKTGNKKSIKVYFRGVNNKTFSSSDNPATFQIVPNNTKQAKIKISGNILSLMDKDVVSWDNAQMPDYCFYRLFLNQYYINDVSSLKLTPKKGSIGLYWSLFQGCTGLVSATTENYLTSVKDNCCRTMYYGCTSLVNIPDTWFPNLKSLTYSTSIGITTTTYFPYNVFMSCFRNTAIKKLPTLPATTLSNQCYAYMFAECTGLTTQTDWKLPATNFKDNQQNKCYAYMFYGCTNLVKVSTMQTSIDTTYNYNWLKNTASNGTIYMSKSSTQSSFSNQVLPTGWSVSKAL